MEELLLISAVPTGRVPVSRLGPYWSLSWRPCAVAVFAEGICTANTDSGPQPVFSCSMLSPEL